MQYCFRLVYHLVQKAVTKCGIKPGLGQGNFVLFCLKSRKQSTTLMGLVQSGIGSRPLVFRQYYVLCLPNGSWCTPKFRFSLHIKLTAIVYRTDTINSINKYTDFKLFSSSSPHSDRIAVLLWRFRGDNYYAPRTKRDSQIHWHCQELEINTSRSLNTQAKKTRHFSTS